MDPSEQGVGEHNAPTDQHSQDQNDTPLQRQQAQQQQQQQTQQVHIQQPQQPEQGAVQQQHTQHAQQQLPDRQQAFQEQRRQLQFQMQHQQHLAQARVTRTHGHHPDVHQGFGQGQNVMMRVQQHQQHHQQQTQPQPQPAPQLPPHVVAPQPQPGMTRSVSAIVPSVAAVGAGSTSKLWEHFVKGEKMQKTNKFFAHCIYCRKVNRDSNTRGERRMMSAHLSTCAEAPEEARQEGLAISRELKLKRSSQTGKKSKSSMMPTGPHGGVSLSPGGKRQRQRPASIHPIPGPSAGAGSSQEAMVAAATRVAAASAHGQADPGGTGAAQYFDPSLGPAMSLPTDLTRTGNITTSDNVRLYYEESGSGHPLILIHDFAGSCKYFEANFRDLAASFRVIRYDLRGHGDSEKPQYGFHMHRLAADLHDIIDHFSLDRVALLGGGLGCSVMWAFVELYGQHKISALLFVDQSPYQMASADGDWRLGSKRMFSEGSLAHMAAELKNNPRAFHEENVRACFTRVPSNVETSMYVNESLKAPPWFLSKLMADHCHTDWRAVLPLVSCPALVIVGKKSKIFPWEGVKYAAENMPHAKLLPFEDGSHYLYIEEAMRFNSTVTAFLQSIVAGA